MQTKHKETQKGPLQGKAQPPEPLGEGKAGITLERLKQMLKEGRHNEIIRMRKPPVHALIEALKDEDDDIGRGASMVLSEMVEKRRKCDWSAHINAFAGALRQDGGMGDVYAAALIAKMAGKHPEYDWSAVVPLMIEDVRNGGAGSKTRAINALGNMGDVSAAPVMVEALEKEKGSSPLGASVRVEAVKALLKIAERHPECDFADAIPAVLDALVDEDLDVRGHAGVLMKKMAGRHPKEIASKIIELVNGRLGDKLKEVSSRNDALAAVINKILLECGKAMKDAA